MAHTLSIGELARRTGARVQTIRYYESIGLIPEPVRTAGNQRIYGREDVNRLKFIRHARELGFSLEDIRSLLTMSTDPGRPCTEADSLAAKHLHEVTSRIERLTAMKDELERMIASCSGNRVADCRILEVLANHDLCRHDRH